MCCGRKPAAGLRRTKSGLKKRLQNPSPATSADEIGHHGEPISNPNFIETKNQEENTIQLQSPPYGVHFPKDQEG